SYKSTAFPCYFCVMGKNLGKLFTLLLFIPIFLGIFGGCDKTPPKTGTLMDFVPQNATVVFKISNFEDLQADIEASSLLSKFGKTLPYSFFTEKKALLKNLHPSSQSLFCINKVNDSLSAYTFISRQTKNLFKPDSLKIGRASCRERVKLSVDRSSSR